MSRVTTVPLHEIPRTTDCRDGSLAVSKDMIIQHYAEGAGGFNYGVVERNLKYLAANCPDPEKASISCSKSGAPNATAKMGRLFWQSFSERVVTAHTVSATHFEIKVNPVVRSWIRPSVIVVEDTLAQHVVFQPLFEFPLTPTEWKFFIRLHEDAYSTGEAAEFPLYIWDASAPNGRDRRVNIIRASEIPKIDNQVYRDLRELHVRAFIEVHDTVQKIKREKRDVQRQRKSGQSDDAAPMFPGF